MCSWCEASARAIKGETCEDQMTDSFQAHKDVMQFLSQARAMRSALVKRLYYAVCAVFMGVLSALPVDFLEFFPGNRNHHHFSDDVGCHEVQLVCHCEVGCCEVEDEDEDAAGGFPQCNTDIQSFDRHSNRSFLLLRIADFVVDAVDVVDVLVSEFVPSPPGEHLAFSDIVLMHRQILVAVEEVSGAHSARVAV